jgi:acid phosphatase (class A)
LGKPEPSYSYPSGHSSCATVYGLIIAELFPEKREAIMAISQDIGWDRVVIGKHFLTDVRAGRVLGQAIVRHLMANPAFQHDLAEAKAEVVAAGQAKEASAPAVLAR